MIHATRTFSYFIKFGSLNNGHCLQNISATGLDRIEKSKNVNMVESMIGFASHDWFRIEFILT